MKIGKVVKDVDTRTKHAALWDAVNALEGDTWQEVTACDKEEAYRIGSAARNLRSVRLQARQRGLTVYIRRRRS